MRLALLAASTALLLATPVLADNPSTPPVATVSVMGSGEAQLKPDFARLFVAVETQGDTVGKVVEANRASSEEVLARLQSLGVKKEDIRTENFQVFQTPARVDNTGKEIKTPKFTANHRLRITSRDLEGVGRLAGEILASPNMLFQSVAFGLDKQEEGGDEARRAAVRDAKRQAELYAQASGVTLGRILEIRDGSAQPYEAPQGGFRVQAMKAAAPAEEIPIVPPASLRYTSTIQMVWEIAPKP
ncbi:SIMPL domain-containing protein [Microvirga puerhi]|uniref:SIMPL domain-containing protein n=1 Tax=Microvirga puerhi TaxID=2876078 RepID=A0ABS7VNQ3_9HYPH|nr:SIMPL domain-containing protein [Microvirga puerhi]MBZ6077129.1 SIMPL domain-containing protein [Microvirga puerhi]